ncbi:MAG: CHASE2 domain-containing protein [Deltaproteobacteria bacterium]|nr:CHASE2 domain-containing protein [Deltaproteobacteria bacterium]
MLGGALVAIVYIFFSFNNFGFFESIERFAYGVQMRLDLPQSMGQNKIAIVNIDDKSLQHLGPWPWPRHLIAEMVQILKNNGAKLVGLDLLFSEKENNQGLQEIKRLHAEIQARDGETKKDQWLLGTIKDIEKRLDNDKILAQTVRACGNVILPVMGEIGQYETELLLAEDSILKDNSLRLPGGKDQYLNVNELVTPFAELMESGMGMGHQNLPPGKSLEGRVHLLLINYRGHILPSVPLRLALGYLGMKPGQVTAQGEGILLKNVLIPTQKGEMFIKFKGGRRSFPYYSFVDILNVRKVPAVFNEKIVLIGYTAKGTNAVNTPVDPQMPHVELTANVIEDILLGRFLKRPGAIIYIEAVFIFLLSLAGSAFLPRFSVLNRAGVVLVFLFLVFISGAAIFIMMGTWFKTTYLVLSLVTVFAVASIKDFIIRERTLGRTTRESIETNRMLGLSLQSQGLYDLAFEKFRKCPLDDAMKDVIYNLALDYERKRMINKAVSVYEYILGADADFRDLQARVPKLRKIINPLSLARRSDGKKEDKIIVSDSMGVKPTVGRYEILSELGQGAMGVVYKARDPKINRMLAIKTIRFSDEFEEGKLQEVKERFLREAEIAGQLSHPGIVAIWDVGEDFDLTYIAMEFLEGDDLHRFSKKGSLLPLRKVLHIIGETASALGYAHERGVIHRDVKPANIMLLKDGKVKMTDYGIAKAVSSSQTKSGIILGTPNYMSPEQINGLEIDGRADIFSLGVVFFELLTGQLPFHGKTLTNLFYQITQGKHPSPRQINPKVPKPCEQIINKALAKDPDQRFQKADDFARYVKAMIAKIDEVRARAKKADL